MEGDLGKGWPNSFQVVELDTQSRAYRIHFRKWARDASPRFWAKGSDIYPNAPDGVLQWSEAERSKTGIPFSEERDQARNVKVIGEDAVLVDLSGTVSRVGDRSVVVSGAPNSNLRTGGGVAFGRGAVADATSVAIGAGAGGGGFHETVSRGRKQAERVTSWLGSEEADRIQVFVRNSSDQLIYDVIASLVSVQGAFRETAVGDSREPWEYRCFIGNVPPGREIESRIEWTGGGMHLRFAIELAFRDAVGSSRVRHGDGRLEHVEKAPVDLYEIPLPISWEH
jgi:hypothetical protein